MTKIRVAKAKDDRTVAGLLIRSFSQLYATIGIGISPEREAYLNNQTDRRAYATSFVHEADGEPMGTVTLVPPSPLSDAWIEGAWDLRLLAVDPRMQGRGIARALIKHAEEWASTAGATGVCLHARRGIPNQARLYRACGYLRDPTGDIDGQPFREGYRKDF